MIRIKCGTCGTSQGYKTPASGDLTLSPYEEARLVARGVADYVTRPIIGPSETVATPHNGENDDGPGVNLPASETGPEGQETTTHLDADDLMTMSLANLKQLARDMGVDDTGLRTKADYAAAIAAIEVIPGPAVEDENELPDLAAEDPVE